MAKFKFPINSLISWNKNPEKVIYRVLGYDHKSDSYNLSVEKDKIFDSFVPSCNKPGYKFFYARVATEQEHKLVPKFKFPIGSVIIRTREDNSHAAQEYTITGYMGNFYLFQANCRGSRDWTEERYSLKHPAFKFPIGSVISWNKNPEKAIYRVLGYDYVSNTYNLVVEKYWDFDRTSPGYKFKHNRELTEKEHTLLTEFSPSINCSLTILPKKEPEWKFKVGDKIISNYSEIVYTVLDIAKLANCYIICGDTSFSTILQTRHYTEEGFKLYVPELAKCIPHDPTKSGWHWLKKNNKSIPHYWDQQYNWWWEPIKKFGTYQEDMICDNWRYDKPCEY